MRRRKYLALTTASISTLLAGCSFNGNETETPTDTPNNTTTPNQTDTPANETDDGPEPPSGIEQPESMNEIAQFAYNHHKKQLEELSYVLTVSSQNETPDGMRAENYTFKFDGENRSVFALEVDTPNQSGTVEKFSTGGIVYTRTNPEGEQITYESNTVDEGLVFRLTGLNQIDQLEQSAVKVGTPEEQDAFVYRYPIQSHNAYDSVSGYIELDIQQGLITAVEFEGQSSNSDYTFSMEFDFGGVTFDTPAWVRDMNN